MMEHAAEEDNAVVKLGNEFVNSETIEENLQLNDSAVRKLDPAVTSLDIAIGNSDFVKGHAEHTMAIDNSGNSLANGLDQETVKGSFQDCQKSTPWYDMTLTNNLSPSSPTSKYNAVSDESDNITDDIADFIRDKSNPESDNETLHGSEMHAIVGKDIGNKINHTFNKKLEELTKDVEEQFEKTKKTGEEKPVLCHNLHAHEPENNIYEEKNSSNCQFIKDSELKSTKSENNLKFSSCSSEEHKEMVNNSLCSALSVNDVGSFSVETCNTVQKAKDIEFKSDIDMMVDDTEIDVKQKIDDSDNHIKHTVTAKGDLDAIYVVDDITAGLSCGRNNSTHTDSNRKPHTENVCNLENYSKAENSHNPELWKALNDSQNDLMKFAEVLYKCTLCTSIPSILTSKPSFLKHITECHITTHRSFEKCKNCSLKFRTENDLKEHVECLHAETKVGSEVKTCDPTGSDVIPARVRSGNTSPNDVIKSLDRLIDNESDSDSSGHRQYKAKMIKRTKPQHDFENPKQLVDHAGIETLNGSLDLSKKDIKSHENVNNHSDNSSVCDLKSPRSKDVVNLVNVHQITDQIMKSNAQGKNGQTSTNGQKLSFTPSFTPEFGKFTKLVREGGNIVYFCQVCNWKSPVKSTFQVHCSISSHKAKVLSAEDPESCDMSDQNSKNPNKDNKIPNVCVGNINDTKFSREAGFWPAQGGSCVSNLPEGSMFYNYIRPRGMNQKSCRTPVVSPYRNGGFVERSDFSYRRHYENAVDFAIKKKKKSMSNSVKGSHTSHYNSDSDSDSKNSANPESHWKTHSANMSLLRSKLLHGYDKDNKIHTGHVVKNDLHHFHGSSDTIELTNQDSPSVSAEGSSGNLDLSIIKNEKQDFSSESKHAEVPFSCNLSSNKRSYLDSVSNLECEPTQKKLKDIVLDTDKRKEADSEMTFKVTDYPLYKCHACPFEYSAIDLYEKHFEKVHKSSTGYAGSPVGSPGAYQRSWLDKVVCNSVQGKQDGQTSKVTPGSSLMASSGNLEMGENWRVQKLKEILPDYLMMSEKGNTSRDYLLQCVSVTAGLPDAALWSSACNKAMREVYPNSLAQRKGKHKNYYFGVSMVESFQGQEEVTLTEPDGGQVYQPLRDINIDMEKIIEQLPAIVKWTGCMEVGVYRGEILMALADILQDQGVLNWGAQCNRAIRLVFPMVDMKRKGKFKTIYFGVDLHNTVRKSLARQNYTEPYLPTYAENSTERAFKKGSQTETDFQNEESTEQKDNSGVYRNNDSAGNCGRDPSETVSVYPQWFKQEARNEMEEYLAKFGGVTMFDETCSNGDDAVHEYDNDGDDEGESVDSGLTT